MAEITTTPDGDYDEPSNIIPIHEINRIMKDAYVSPFASGVALLRKFDPESISLTEPTYIGTTKRFMQPADRDLTMFQAINDAITTFRLTIAHMFEHRTEQDTEKALRWSLSNMGNAFARLAKNRPEKME